MAGRRKNGEGSWGTKTINGIKYKFYKDVNGKYFYGKTNTEINAKKEDYYNKHKDAKEHKKKKSIIDQQKEVKLKTFGEGILEWLNTEKSTNIKKTTFDGYEDCINGQIINYKGHRLADKQIGALDLETINDYYASLSNIYTSGTIKKNYAIVSQYIEYCNDNNFFDENINIDKIKLPKENDVAKKRREINFLSEEDVKLFCKEAKRINVPGFCFGKLGEPTYGNNAYILMFIVVTGLRIGEAMALQWNDVNKNDKFIIIRKTSVTIKNRGQGQDDHSPKHITSTQSTKTRAGERIVPLNKTALEIIAYEESLNPNHQSTDYVFINKNGEQIKSRQNINRTLKNIMSRAGCSVNNLTPHELRHTFGSLLIEKGVDIKVVSELLGHKDIKMTYNIYIHVLEKQKAKAITVLDKINI